MADRSAIELTEATWNPGDQQRSSSLRWTLERSAVAGRRKDVRAVTRGS